MANENRLIVADALETRMGNLCDEFGTDHLFIDAIIYEIGTAPHRGCRSRGAVQGLQKMAHT